MKLGLTIEFQDIVELKEMLDGPLGKLLKDSPASVSETQAAVCDAWLDEHGQVFYEVFMDDKVNADWNRDNLIKILRYARKQDSRSINTEQIKTVLGLDSLPEEGKPSAQAFRVLRLVGDNLFKNPRGATPIKEKCGTEWMFDISRYYKGNIYKLRAATIHWIDTYLEKAK